MANLSKVKRERMLAFLETLKNSNNADETVRAFNEIENHIKDKKYGLVWETHEEQVDELLKDNIPVLSEDTDRKLVKDSEFPFNFLIEGDNLQALYLLEKTHKNRIDCIYIDPHIILVQKIGNIIMIMLISRMSIDIANGFRL